MNLSEALRKSSKLFEIGYARIVNSLNAAFRERSFDLLIENAGDFDCELSLEELREQIREALQPHRQELELPHDFMDGVWCIDKFDAVYRDASLEAYCEGILCEDQNRDYWENWTVKPIVRYAERMRVWYDDQIEKADTKKKRKKNRYLSKPAERAITELNRQYNLKSNKKRKRPVIRQTVGDVVEKWNSDHLVDKPITVVAIEKQIRENKHLLHWNVSPE